MVHSRAVAYLCHALEIQETANKKEEAVMRYDTVEQLRDAYRDGEIHGPLMIDNDDTSVYSGGEQVFEMHPEDLLEQALNLLGIPNEHV